MSWILCPVGCSQCELKTVHGRTTAECTTRNLKAIPSDLERNIQVLMFSNNHLTYLAMDAFRDYVALQEIRLVRNRIDMIAPDAFRSLSNLQLLDLEGNKLKSLDNNIFQHLSSVRVLILKSNPLDILTKDTFKHLKNVEELNFENCWIYRIHPETFSGLDNLLEVNLINNELKLLDPNMQQHLPPTLNVFRLYRNPWVCDCNLRWLRNYLDVNKIAWNFITNVPVCDSPELLHSLTWTNLDSEKFKEGGINFVEIAREKSEPVWGAAISCTEKFCALYSPVGPVHARIVPLTDVKMWSTLGWADVATRKKAEADKASKQSQAVDVAQANPPTSGTPCVQDGARVPRRVPSSVSGQRGNRT